MLASDFDIIDPEGRFVRYQRFPSLATAKSAVNPYQCYFCEYKLFSYVYQYQ